MIRSIIWTALFSIIAGILQSTIRGSHPFLSIVPDIALCIVVYSAYVNGTMPGQVSGFFSGLLLDFLSAAPMGINCFVRTIIGAFTGLFKGAFFLDYIFMPAILCAIATIMKAALIFVIYLLMPSSVEINTYSFTNSTFWIELGLNTLFAPVLFLLLRKFRPILVGKG